MKITSSPASASHPPKYPPTPPVPRIATRISGTCKRMRFRSKALTEPWGPDVLSCGRTSNQENNRLDHEQLFPPREGPPWVRPVLDQFLNPISRTRCDSLVSGPCSLPDVFHECRTAGCVSWYVGRLSS